MDLLDLARLWASAYSSAPDEPTWLRSDDRRYVLVVFQSGRSGDELGLIDPNLYFAIQDMLHEVLEDADSERIIDIWLESPGGDANMAYKLCLHMRALFEVIRVVVPNYAKSAATLLAIGADEIIMSPAAELGPLDVQLPHPDREDVRISGLDASRALGFLGEFAYEYMIEAGYNILGHTALPRKDILREISGFTARFLEPVVAKLDAQLVHQAARHLDLAKRYAEIMLKMRRPTKNGDEVAEYLPEHLVTHYPGHEYLISRREAMTLGLPVKKAEKYDLWSMVQDLHTSFRDGKFRGPRTDHLILASKVSDLHEKIEALGQDD